MHANRRLWLIQSVLGKIRCVVRNKISKAKRCHRTCHGADRIRITAMCRSICVHNLPFIRLECRISSAYFFCQRISVLTLHLQLRNVFRRHRWHGFRCRPLHHIGREHRSKRCAYQINLTRIIVQINIISARAVLISDMNRRFLVSRSHYNLLRRRLEPEIGHRIDFIAFNDSFCCHAAKRA